MFFRKKRKMVDLRELQQRGVVRIPKNIKNTEVPTDKDGFVEFGDSPKSHSVVTIPQSATKPSSAGGFLDFMGNNSPSPAPPSTDEETQFSTESNGYNKREVDEKTEAMDNKIYKLEQRIELLERKAGVDSGPADNSSVGVMGW